MEILFIFRILPRRLLRGRVVITAYVNKSNKKYKIYKRLIQTASEFQKELYILEIGWHIYKITARAMPYYRWKQNMH